MIIVIDVAEIDAKVAPDNGNATGPQDHKRLDSPICDRVKTIGALFVNKRIDNNAPKNDKQ